MGYSELGLPVDIPWKRMAVAGDMLDSTYDDNRYPPKFCSSIAAFYHEPLEVNPAYCNRRITYLKIVCTITNYQPLDEDVTALKKIFNPHQAFFDSIGIVNNVRSFEANVTRAFPCHGALVQVAVHPNPSTDVPLYDYPYISSLQPRKRELYEVATQSGEVASQSANKLNVLKGTTTTGTLEDYDLDMGGGTGGHSTVLWSEQHTDPGKQYGTINRRQTQDQNVSTSDASRDRREQHSFSTSINQLNTLLQSYHLGTNRVMFFLEPAPHMQDAKFSFVRGARRLEGIQEFFLIVNRPARVPGICLEVTLETAHPYVRTAYQPRLIALGDLFAPGNLAKTEAALGLGMGGVGAIPPEEDFSHHRRIRDAWNGTWHDRRWAMNQSSYYPTDEEEALASQVIWMVPGIGVEDCAMILEEYEAWDGNFFVSANKLCACWTPKSGSAPVPGAEPVEEDCEDSSPANLSACAVTKPSIVYEGRLAGQAALARAGGQKAMSHNASIKSVNDSLFSSLQSSDRAEPGQLSFLDTEFFLGELAELTRVSAAAIPDRPLGEYSSFQRFVKAFDLPEVRRIGEASVQQFGAMSTEHLARSAGIPVVDAKRWRLEMLMEAVEQVDPARLPKNRDGLDYAAPTDSAARAIEVARGVAEPSVRRPGTTRRRCRFKLFRRDA